MSYNGQTMQADLSAWMAEARRRVQVEAHLCVTFTPSLNEYLRILSHSCVHSIENELARPLWSRFVAFAELNPATTVGATRDSRHRDL